ncbi:MAG: glycosyltransferase [Verrucomicrobiae bacterium]|nr:glycosyltransferase [Verrucomicrobiae bacterium]
MVKSVCIAERGSESGTELATIEGLGSVSFVVPAMNEEVTLRTLFDGVKEVIEPLAERWEMLFIDDGSTDSTWEKMCELAEEYPDIVRTFRFQRNLGKSSALALGYREAHGDYVFTMDADLQDDPQEIPRFLAKMREGFDVVSGWKRKRYDPWHKVLPSRVFNWIISNISGVKLHDHNCGFKCYRNEVVKKLPMYGNMHRMVPSFAGILGYKTGEIPVQHHARQFGVSKYGVKRILHGIADMWTVYFLKKYPERPQHFFMQAAGVAGAFAVLVGLATWLLPFVTGSGVIAGTMLATTLLAAAFIVFMLGFLGEQQTSQNYRAQREISVAETKGRGIPRLNEARIDVIEVVKKERKSPKALVVDDDVTIVRLMRKFLESDGWEVLTAHTADAGMNLLDSTVDVAFVDVHLPDRDFSETISKIRATSPGTQVVSFTSDRDVRLSVQAFRRGVSDYLLKPIARDEVLATAKSALWKTGADILEA